MRFKIFKNNNGPVHINCPFEEPLYTTVDKLDYTVSLIHKKTTPTVNIDLDTIRSEWKSYKKIMVIVGARLPENDTHYIDLLRQLSNVIILKETTSNIEDYSDVISTIDRVIAPLNKDAFKTLQPDLVISIGGLIVSKKIKQFLRAFAPKAHWHIGDNRANDTFFKLSMHIKLHPSQFFKRLLDFKPLEISKSDYKALWVSIHTKHRMGHKLFLEAADYSDLKVFETLLDAIPESSNLQLSNSSTIRYTQLFGVKSSVNVFCNRGTSGIDGSTSTAIGAATTSDKVTTLITGDLSFFYDSNALWNSYCPTTFRIVVINNGGGGIFRILPSDDKASYFGTYFETQHQLTAKQLCKMHGFKYSSASSGTALKTEINAFYTSSKTPKLLEIFTPRVDNAYILKQYFEALQ